MPTRRVSSCILPLLLLSLQALSQETDLFSVYYPCSVETVNVSVARECDVFVFSAVELALERIMSQNNDSLMEFLSLSTHTNGVFNERATEVLYTTYSDVVNFSEDFEESVSVLRGSLGPAEDYVLGKAIVGLADSAGIPQVSYGQTDSRLNESTGFFRTLPSTLALVNARLSLLRRFEWFRIGLLGSEDLGYRYQKQVFSQAFHEVLDIDIAREFTLSYDGTSTNILFSLTELHKANVTIILAFFTPAEARTVLCEASSPAYGLTSPEHVWILPAYYSPDWWRGDRDNPYSHQRTNNCTDQEMMDILQSVIFIDPVKFPPMGTSLSDFYEDLLNKTLSLYPELGSREELLPLLLNSRAVSAYDATLLLVNSLNNHSVDTALLRGSMLCEICEIYTVNMFTEMGRDYCDSVTLSCQNNSLRVPNPTSKQNTTTQDSYGQVIISQFINGTLCPMVMYWHSNLSEGEQSRYFVPISNLTAGPRNELGLDPLLRFSERADCPLEFVWKDGTTVPPSPNFQLIPRIPVISLIFVSIFTGLLEILIVCLIVFTVVWRDNRHVRPTSPKLSIAMLIAGSLAVPQSLLQGLVLSGADHLRDSLTVEQSVFSSILCQVEIWVCEVALTFLLGVLGGKLRRLYEIFRNKSLKVKLMYLKDYHLLLWAALLLVPDFILLIAWNAREPYVHTINTENNMDFQIVYLSRCNPGDVTSELLRGLRLLYKMFLFLCIVGMLLLIRGTPKSIKLNLYITRVTLLFATCMFWIGVFGASGLATDLINANNQLELHIQWWFNVALNLGFVGILICGLFPYQVVLVFKDYRDSVRVKHKNKQDSVYYAGLELERERLSISLAKKEDAIVELKARKSMSKNSEQTSQNPSSQS